MTCNTRVLRIKFIALEIYTLLTTNWESLLQFWIHSLGVYSSVSTTDLSSEHNPRDHDWSQGRHSPFLQFLSNQAPLHPRFVLLSLVCIVLILLSLIRFSPRILSLIGLPLSILSLIRLSLALLPLVLLSAMTRPKIIDCPYFFIGARGLGCK